MVGGRGRGRAAERWGKLQKSYFQFENYFRNGNGKDKIKTERQKNTQIYNIFTPFSVLPTSYFSCFFLFAFSHIFHLSHAVLKNLIKLFSFHFGCELTFLFIIALAHVAVLIHCTANGDGRRCEVIAGVGEGGGDVLLYAAQRKCYRGPLQMACPIHFSDRCSFYERNRDANVDVPLTKCIGACTRMCKFHQFKRLLQRQQRLPRFAFPHNQPDPCINWIEMGNVRVYAGVVINFDIT